MDIAKPVFRPHGADASGPDMFRKKLSRGLLALFARSPTCRIEVDFIANAGGLDDVGFSCGARKGGAS